MFHSEFSVSTATLVEKKSPLFSSVPFFLLGVTTFSSWLTIPVFCTCSFKGTDVFVVFTVELPGVDTFKNEGVDVESCLLFSVPLSGELRTLN